MTTAVQEKPLAGAIAGDRPSMPVGGSLRRLAVRGAAWSVAGYAASQVMRLGGNLVLTRLLFPEAFGLMLLINMCIQGLEMFSDVGSRANIIQSRRGNDQVFLNTAWTIQVIRGFGLSLCAALLAWPLARWYDARLLYLLPVAGLAAAISGFNSTALITRNRELKLASITMLDFAAQSLGLVVMVVWSLVHPTVWALVGGGLVSATVRMLLSHLISRKAPNRFHWDPTAGREIYRFGRWIFAATAASFLASQGDRLLLGRYLTMELLGLYGIAFFLSNSVALMISSVSHNVLFPAFSRVARETPHRLQEVYYRTRLRLDVLSLPVAGALMTSGAVLVRLLYDSRYEPAGWMLQVLAIKVAVAVTLPAASVCLLALGNPRYGLAAASAKTLWICTGIPVGWYAAGLTGVVWVMGLSDLVLLPLALLGLHRHGVLRPGRELLSFALVPPGAALGYLLTRSLM